MLKSAENKEKFQMNDEIYSLENVPLFEAMYGPGLISLGGYEAIDQMFKGMDISTKRLLDFGSGIGGMAYYLASKYHAFVTGLEIHPWMTQYATNHTPEILKDHVTFVTYDQQGLIPVPPQTFDIVCSKGVLTHVADKRKLFLDLHRILKPSGQLCFMDWIVPEEIGPQNEIRPWGEVSCKETQSSYQKILADCGFMNVTFQNESKSYLTYAKRLGSVLESQDFKGFATDTLREILIISNLKLIKDIESGDQISVRIVGSCTKEYPIA